jgi:hypothetical protein
MKDKKTFIFKTIFLGLVVFLVISLAGQHLSSLTWSSSQVIIPKQDPFQVSAQGEIYTTPDTATIVLGVEKEEKTVTKAQEEINKVNSEVIEKLKELGIKKEKIKTTNYTINPRYEWNNETGQRRLVGYQASINISVKTQDFEKLNQIIDQATRAGVNNVVNLSFGLENEDETKQQAQNQAIDKAKEKAQAIAKASGLELGRLINVSVTEDNGYYPSRDYYALDEAFGGGEKIMEPTQLEPGETKITVRATLSYEIK